jgi:glycosyltransferase involved in cell wall biosynthesis
MTLGFFSPMPPARTGVADYSAVLFEEMRKLGPVRLTDDAADVRLYHLGNNPLHQPMYRQALATPGVVVLHDAVLHHFFLGSLTEAEYRSEFIYNYGTWNESLAGRLWRNRARSGVDPLYFRYPMLRRIVERSLGVIVHNPAAARSVREHYPAARVYEIPHLLLPATRPAAYEVIRLRAELGATPSDGLFGVFGHLRESKRLIAVLEVFGKLRRAGERVMLLVAGDFVSRDLARSARTLLGHPGIRRTGYTPESTFSKYAHAVDACINLRYPAAGETSGIAIRMMGIGKPVLLTGGEETSRLPEAAVLRVDAGPAERDMLSEYMLWLTRFPGHGRAIGACARRHVEAHHHPALVAAQYWKALEEACVVANR